MKVRGVLNKVLAVLKKVGASLILPVSVLPAAGILLGVGSAEFSWLPMGLSNMLKISGGAVFSAMPLIFAVGVALGFTDKKGTSALAAVVGYVVFVASLGASTAYFAGRSIQELVEMRELTEILGIPSMSTGVLGGVLIGGIAAWLFNRYHDIELPDFLGFFGGERFVPIVTVLAAVTMGVIMSIIWPPINNVIQAFSQWAAYENPVVAFSIYGVIERFVLPLGLNHIWNAPFFFETGQYLDPRTAKIVTGELARYAAADPTAGNLAGGYLFKMFGLPAAAMAIWHSAKPENRAKVGSLMVSGALVSFLTGITEPIEFSFLFVAPILYVIHAFLAGCAFGLSIFLNIRHSISFAHGLIDYIVYFPLSTNALWLIPVGLAYAVLYYLLFTFLIRVFNLKTPGREVL